jgi:hypothetical protein
MFGRVAVGGPGLLGYSQLGRCRTVRASLYTGILGAVQLELLFGL